jgi:hypothetical protein
LTFGAGSVTSWQIIREEDLNMSISVTIEELYGLEQLAKANADSSPQFDVAVRASTTLRDLMTQELSQKNLLKYLPHIPRKIYKDSGIRSSILPILYAHSLSLG